MLPLSKCGNAGRIAQWILEEIGDPLDYWCHGNGVTTAKLVVKLAIGDTIVTLENKWWGVRGFITSEYTPNPPLRLWYLHDLWAPVWLRERFYIQVGAGVLMCKIAYHTPWHWNEDHASEKIRAALPPSV